LWLRRRAQSSSGGELRRRAQAASSGGVLSPAQAGLKSYFAKELLSCRSLPLAGARRSLPLAGARRSLALAARWR